VVQDDLRGEIFEIRLNPIPKGWRLAARVLNLEQIPMGWCLAREVLPGGLCHFHQATLRSC